jgi:hypothetical protein
LPDQDVKGAVDALLAHMEVAAERDMESNRAGQPAVMKLKMLAEVRNVRVSCIISGICAGRGSRHQGFWAARTACLHARSADLVSTILGCMQQPLPCILRHVRMRAEPLGVPCSGAAEHGW